MYPWHNFSLHIRQTLTDCSKSTLPSQQKTITKLKWFILISAKKKNNVAPRFPFDFEDFSYKKYLEKSVNPLIHDEVTAILKGNCVQFKKIMVLLYLKWVFFNYFWHIIFRQQNKWECLKMKNKKIIKDWWVIYLRRWFPLPEHSVGVLKLWQMLCTSPGRLPVPSPRIVPGSLLCHLIDLKMEENEKIY